MRWLAIPILFSLLVPLAQAEHYVYWSYPNRQIPYQDSIGVIDTIIIDENVIIEDLNIYVGMETHTWAWILVIPIISPWQDSVYLLNRNLSRRYLNIWFDTEDTVDGPGNLANYNGHNSRGNWIIKACQPYGNIDFVFDSWAVEIYGVPTGVKDEIEKPLEFGIISTYPNPFNSRVRIQFALTEPAHTSFKIYNILGQEVATLLDTDLPPAFYSVTWDAGGLPSGTYYYRLKSGERSATGEVTLVK